MIKYLYGIVLFTYGITELIVQFTYKNKGNKGKKDKKEIDITYFLVFIPFSILLIIPNLIIFIKDYTPPIPIIISFLTIFGLGIVLRMISYKDLSRQFSDKVELKENHKLITSGLYKYIRHPLYLAGIFMCIGSFLYYISLITAIFAVLTFSGIIIRIEKEEKFLKKNLEGYTEYCVSTKKLIPKIY